MRTATAVVFTGLLVGAAAAGCRVDRDSFYERIYSCNPNAANPACGTDRDDQPMACVPAYQLGGRNFCAPGCSVDSADSTSSAGADAICLPAGPRQHDRTAGARLARCDPAAPGSSCHHDELSCLRTDLIQNEGVCMTVNTCREDRDCRDPVRSKCMGTLLREAYSKADLQTDNSYCLQADCRAHRTACSPGETCMSDVLPASSRPPDICVPNCDANGNCPPNYFCYSSVYSKKLPPICIPGLLGLRCNSDLDCLFGECRKTAAKTATTSDAAFKVCAVRCSSDVDCAKYDSVHATLFCTAEGWCAGVRASRGTQCDSDADCQYDGEICARITNLLPKGQCLQPCPARKCDALGGVPHACRPQVDATGALVTETLPWVCWPGYLGQLCSESTDCLPGLSCLAAGPRAPGLKVCSSPCMSDGDCAASRFSREGWCDPGAGICRSPLLEGDPCERGNQCDSRSCLGPTSEKRCGPVL
jgi:hypothetical protein